MKRALVLIAGLALVAPSFGWERLQNGASPQFLNTGDSARGLNVSVGTTTPVAVYTPTMSARTPSRPLDRRIIIQNFTNYTLYLATSTAFTATTGPRWVVVSSGSFTTDDTATIYGLYEPSAGASKEVNGRVEYDSKD